MSDKIIENNQVTIMGKVATELLSLFTSTSTI